MTIKIKAVIFDMDGVLVDAREWHFNALNKALALFGMKIDYQDHLCRFDGLPTKDKLSILGKEKNLPQELFGFIDALKQKYTVELIATCCYPRFSHEYLLSKLSNEGYKLAVASNSVRHTVREMLTRSNIINYFDFYLSNQDVIKSKPSPEIYHKAIHRLGFQAQECLIVEDNDNGIRAAQLSGAHVLAVKDIDDVNYLTIKNKIGELERLSC